MSFRYFPHAVLFIGTFFFLTRGILIIMEKKVRIPFTFRNYLEGSRAVILGIAFLILALICAWDLVMLFLTPAE